MNSRLLALALAGALLVAGCTGNRAGERVREVESGVDAAPPLSGAFAARAEEAVTVSGATVVAGSAVLEVAPGSIPDGASVSVGVYSSTPEGIDAAVRASTLPGPVEILASREVEGPLTIRLPVAGPTAQLIYLDAELGTWTPVTTRVEGGQAVASVDHLTPFDATVSWLGYVIQDLFGNRGDPPSCTGPLPAWLHEVGVVEDRNAPLLACGEDAGDGRLRLRVVNNRGHAQSLVIPGAALDDALIGVGDGVGPGRLEEEGEIVCEPDRVSEVAPPLERVELPDLELEPGRALGLCQRHAGLDGSDPPQADRCVRGEGPQGEPPCLEAQRHDREVEGAVGGEIAGRTRVVPDLQRGRQLQQAECPLLSEREALRAAAGAVHDRSRDLLVGAGLRDGLDHTQGAVVVRRRVGTLQAQELEHDVGDVDPDAEEVHGAAQLDDPLPERVGAGDEDLHLARGGHVDAIRQLAVQRRGKDLRDLQRGGHGHLGVSATAEMASPAATISGIGIGSTEEGVEAAYPGQIERTRHEYEPDGAYLTLIPRDLDDQAYRLRFSTDGATVQEIHAGFAPAVGYVEGCA